MHASPRPAVSGAMIFYSDFDDYAAWRDAMQACLPGLRVVHGNDAYDPADIHYALVWKAPQGFFDRMKNLRLIVNLGAGVDSLVGREDLPAEVPITRLTDPNMARMMAGYVLFAALRYARDIPYFEAAQRRGEWAYRHPPLARDGARGSAGPGRTGRLCGAGTVPPGADRAGLVAQARATSKASSVTPAWRRWIPYCRAPTFWW